MSVRPHARTATRAQSLLLAFPPPFHFHTLFNLSPSWCLQLAAVSSLLLLAALYTGTYPRLVAVAPVTLFCRGIVATARRCRLPRNPWCCLSEKRKSQKRRRVDGCVTGWGAGGGGVGKWLMCGTVVSDRICAERRRRRWWRRQYAVGKGLHRMSS